MQKNSFRNITIFSLIGLVGGTFSLVWGTWLTRPLGPHMTGIELWLNIQKMISGPEILPDTDLKRNIFFWLSLIIVGIILQGVITLVIFNQRRLLGWIISISLWAIIFTASSVLVIAFSAVESGIVLLTTTSLLALAGEASVMLGGLSQKQQNHKQSISKAVERWAIILEEAIEHNTPFAVLAIYTNPQISYLELQQLQNELRGRDLLFPVLNGLFIMLWQNTPANTPLISNKLLSVLQGFTTRHVQMGSACFPEDGNNLKLLLSRAVQALEIAQKTGGSVIIPFSTPKTRTTHSGQALWEAILQEVHATRSSAVILSFKTERPLNLVETHLVQNEVRGRDQVSVLETGFYVILWNTNREGGQVVKAKLETILAKNSIAHQSDLAALPEDGNTLAAHLQNLG